jgi:hypothetical protein
MQAVSEERDEDVGFNFRFVLLVYGPDGEITLQGSEGALFDLDEQQVVFPQCGGVSLGQVAAQEIAAFASSYLPELITIERMDEHRTFVVHCDLDEAPCCRRPCLGLSQFDEQPIVRQVHRHLLQFRWR